MGEQMMKIGLFIWAYIGIYTYLRHWFKLKERSVLQVIIAVPFMAILGPIAIFEYINFKNERS